MTSENSRSGEAKNFDRAKRWGFFGWKRKLLSFFRFWWVFWFGVFLFFKIEISAKIDDLRHMESLACNFKKGSQPPRWITFSSRMCCLENKLLY